jgi:hypothetical protein
MSLLALTGRDQVAIERVAVTQSPTGGQVRDYSAQNRDGLPTSAACRIQPLSADERVAYGVRGVRLAWKLLFAEDPVITPQDRVTFIDADQRTHTASIVQPSINLDGQSRLYRAIVLEQEEGR